MMNVSEIKISLHSFLYGWAWFLAVKNI